MKFGFIGAGNMGAALCCAVSKNVEGKEIFIADYDTAKSTALANELKATPSTNQEIASLCDFIVLGVKPQVMESVLTPLKETLKKRTSPFTLITMAAGLSTHKIKEFAGDFPVIRIMPNTPVRYGEGMVLYTVNGANKTAVDEFLRAFNAAGRLALIEERLIDAASAVSGCGPAFAFMFMDALACGGVECGLSYSDALTLAAQTLLGSAKTVLESGTHPEELKTNVCSPGGTTIEGVHALEEGAFKATSMNAVKAAYQKTLKLAGK